MKNEGPFILEWLAYHKVIGFEKFLIFSNNSDDGTTEILEALDSVGEIKHCYQDINSEQVVSKIVATAAKDSDFINVGDWVVWLDADEFLNVHVGDGTVHDLINHTAPAQGICVGWRIFGDSNQSAFSGRFISKDFTKCALQGKAWNNVKTLFRYDEQLDHLFQHKPIMKKDFWNNGGVFLGPKGIPLLQNTALMTQWVAGRERGKIDKADCGWDLAQINHYAVRTKTLFEFKQKRGRIGAPNLAQNNRYSQKYFNDLNCNEDCDTTILKWTKKTGNEISRLLEFPPIRIAVQESLSKHYPREVVGSAVFALEERNKMNTLDEIEMSTSTSIYQKMHKSHHDEMESRCYSNQLLAAEISKILSPRSVLDVGCGIGLLMSFMKRNGVLVSGIDGHWLKDEDLICDPKDYMRHDLESKLQLDKKFDVCTSIEVAEHLDPSRAISFVEDLTTLSDAIVFSAAISGQGGKGHKNEQWQEYWVNIFLKKGYELYDPFRAKFRSDEKVLPWFQQNVLLFLKAGHKLENKLAKFKVPSSSANMILPTYHKKILNRLRKRHKLLLEKASTARGHSAVFKPFSESSTVEGLSLKSSTKTSNQNILISTCMKDEGPFIIEWVAWHKAMGINDIVVFTNDCTDGTVEILDRLDELGELTHLPNPATVFDSSVFQPRALSYTTMLPVFRAADYFISMDVDEFINVRIGGGHINDLLEAVGNFDVLSMTEINHGSNKQIHFEPGWVTDIFRSHQTTAPGNRKAQRGVKSIVCLNDKVENIRNHRPDIRKDKGNVRWLDGSSRQLTALMNDASQNGIDCRGSYDLVALDHYPLRSLESFLIKMFRGDVVMKGKRVSNRYWRLRNKNESETITFQKNQIGAARQYYDRLVSDSKLQELQGKTCLEHKRRIEMLLNEPDYIERKNWIFAEAWD